MIGLRIFAIGELSISPSSSSQRKNCCSDRYRVAAEEGEVHASSAAMNASTCSRLMLATAAGMPLSMRNAANRVQSSV
jgi:hypothetical protein